jgi:hypothetical protein
MQGASTASARSLARSRYTCASRSLYPWDLRHALPIPLPPPRGHYKAQRASNAAARHCTDETTCRPTAASRPTNNTCATRKAHKQRLPRPPPAAALQDAARRPRRQPATTPTTRPTTRLQYRAQPGRRQPCYRTGPAADRPFDRLLLPSGGHLPIVGRNATLTY